MGNMSCNFFMISSAFNSGTNTLGSNFPTGNSACCNQNPFSFGNNQQGADMFQMGMMMGMMMWMMAMFAQLMQMITGGQAGGFNGLPFGGGPGGSFASPFSPGGSPFSFPGSPGGPGGITSAPPAGNFPGFDSGSANAVPFDGRSNPAMMRLANAARNAALNRNTTGWCLAGVQDALQAAGMGGERLPSAYMKADQLARDPRFKEVSVPRDQLRNLPPGAIIVWAPYQRSDGSWQRHGHISVSLGNGQEASDHIQNVANINSQARVFIPVA